VAERRRNSYHLIRQVESVMDKSRGSNREFFNDRAVGDRFVFDRLKVKVDCLTDMPPGFFQSIPFGNATRKRRYIRGVTAFIGWFVHDSDSHARSRFNGAAAILTNQLLALRLRTRDQPRPSPANRRPTSTLPPPATEFGFLVLG
jgi:hypothetical protein